MSSATYSFTSELWEWQGKASWFFVSVPEDGSPATVWLRVLV